MRSDLVIDKEGNRRMRVESNGCMNVLVLKATEGVAYIHKDTQNRIALDRPSRQKNIMTTP